MDEALPHLGVVELTEGIRCFILDDLLPLLGGVSSCIIDEELVVVLHELFLHSFTDGGAMPLWLLPSIKFGQPRWIRQVVLCM